MTRLAVLDPVVVTVDIAEQFVELTVPIVRYWWPLVARVMLIVQAGARVMMESIEFA